MYYEKFIDFIEQRKVERVICCFSGGRDSLVATHLAHELLRKSGLEIPIEVLHVDTTVAIPAVQEYVRSVSEKMGWKLVVVKPKKSFWELAASWGMPTPRQRWCCYRLKVEPMIEYAMKLREKVICFVTGMRRSESRRRKNLRGWHLRRIGCKALYSYDPIVDWSDFDVDKYVEERGLPLNPVAEAIGFSGECICGAFVELKALVRIAQRYPEFVEQFRRLEEAWKEGKFRGKQYSVFYASGRKLTVDELLKVAERRGRETLEKFFVQ